MNFQSLLKTNMLVKHLAGSHAYGTAMETSDTDYRGLFYVSEDSIISPWFNVDQITDPSEEDTVYYELRKFMKLLVVQNPNIIETLWVKDEDVIFRTPVYDYLRANRELLLSSKVAFTYSGYASAQIKRIKGHNKWLNNPMPKERPRQDSFLKLIHNYTKRKMFKFDIQSFNEGYMLVPCGNDIYGIYEKRDKRISDVDGNILSVQNDFTFSSLHDQIEENNLKKTIPLLLVKYCREEYKTAVTKWKQYWDWKTNRNVKRNELEQQYGYDTKHALHLVRLMRMAKEILTTGIVNVYRADADELLAIRNGSMTYDDLIKWSDDIDNKIRNKYYKETSLRKQVNIKKATEILLKAYHMCWRQMMERCPKCNGKIVDYGIEKQCENNWYNFNTGETGSCPDSLSPLVVVEDAKILQRKL